ncbi:MAG: hypothetical protein AAFO03_18640 [Bacteroidota bacterium]
MSQQYRYPGVTPFTREQQHLFFGRADAVDQLYKLVQREELVVLHGKSGLGKSSLINAGLLPKVEVDKRFQPLIVRLGARSEDNLQSPLDKTKAVLPSTHPLLERLSVEDDALWTRAKALQLSDNQSPLLIFDQFEELFSYSESDIKDFLQDLAELLFTGIPLRYRRQLDRTSDLTDEEEDQLEEPLRARILIAIRSDRLHLLGRFKSYIPNVLRHNFELQALSRDAARDAIVQPAALAGDFHSAPYTYDDAVLDKLLSYLEDENTGQVEGILIQMLCEHYEKTVVVPQKLERITVNDISEPGNVVRDYYQEKIGGLAVAEQAPARKLIEEGLVSEGEQGMRLSLHENTIESQYNVDRDLLGHLVDQRLLRSEPFLRGGYTFELSHDRLLPAVVQARAERLEAEARARQAAEAERLRAEAEAERKEKEEARRQLRTVRVLLGLAVGALILAGYFGIRSSQQARQLVENNDRLEQSFTDLEAANEEIKAQQAEIQKRLDAYIEAERLRKETQINQLLTRANTYENLNQRDLVIKNLQAALEIDSTRTDIRQRLEALTGQ